MARVKPSGSSAREWYQKGCDLKSAGRLAEAVAAFTTAIERDTGFAEAYFNRGACHYLLGRYHLTAQDMDAASLLGCDKAWLWGKFGLYRFEDPEEEDNPA